MLGAALCWATALLAGQRITGLSEATGGANKSAPAVPPPTMAPSSENPVSSIDRWAPANDNCADAIAISGWFEWVPFTTAGATDDGPVPSCQSNTHKNIWYCWTAETDGRANAGTWGSPFDTVLTVYDGCDCSNLTEIACDDDSYYEGSQSELVFDVLAGHSYMISVGGWNTNGGTGLLSVVKINRFLGACCLDDECIGTMEEEPCLDLGGWWQFGGDCVAYVCGECPEDRLTVNIGLDERPSETSWELVDEGTGEVIGSSGGYTTSGMPFTYSFCLANEGCYNFTIYDSGGDGLCCAYGSGDYSLVLNDTLIKYGGEFGAFETTRLGNGCGWPTGACCASGDCLGTIIEVECNNQFGTFFVGEDCATFTCPPVLDECPATTMAGQDIPQVPWEITIVTSDTAGSGIQLGDSFADASGTIYGLHWWGAWLNYETGPCVEPDPSVLIRFYEDVGGEPGALACEYRVVPTWVPAGVTAGDGIDVLYFSVDLLIPPCNLTSGWVSIQGDGEDPECPFQWVMSDQGDGWLYMFQPMSNPFRGDLSYCLDSAYEPAFGACCDDLTGTCQDGIEIAYCTGRFVAGAPCGSLSPPCGQPDGACCHADGTCEIVPEAACADNWLGPWTECDDCPCVVACPPGAVLEAEPCGDSTNDGCNMFPPMFNPITPGVPVCGTIWADGGIRDTDWYEIVTTESTTFTWAVEGEFGGLPVVCGLVPTVPAGVPDCDTVTVLDPYNFAYACTPISINTICLPAGTYWFYVSAAGVYGLPCGADNDYVATLTAVPCIITGACCYNNGYNCVDNPESECAALGGDWWVYESCTTHECVTPCPEAAIDIEVFTDWYPLETRWEVTDAITGEIIAAEGPYEEWEHLYTRRVCVPWGRCFTFTIHDSYGNGICCNWGNGYYNVYYEGALIRTGGRFGLEESCDMGPGCPPRPWACCVAGACLGDLTEADCAATGGTWVAESRCADGYDCAGEVDFRLVAPVINAEGTSCNRDDDCYLSPAEDVEYVVSIPEDGLWAFSLCGSAFVFDTMLFVGTTRCGQEIGYNDQFCDMGSQVNVHIPAGDYYVTIEGYSPADCGQYVLNVVQLETCEVECPPGATPEGEPDCYDDYVDVTNAGCGSYPPVFTPITCGETVCGTSGTYLYEGEMLTADSDWYQIELPAAATVKWDVCATFAAQVQIFTAYMNDCEYAYAVSSARGPANAPTTAGAALEAGVYWLSVTPDTDPDRGFIGVPCGSPYVATLTVEPDVCMCGDFTNDGLVNADDYWVFIAAFGRCDYEDEYNAACDLDGDGCVTFVDFQKWMVCYQFANGGRQFVVPPRPRPRPPVGPTSTTEPGLQPAPQSTPVQPGLRQ